MPSCTFSMALLTKIITICLAILITIITIITMVTNPFNLFNLIISIYYILFMIVLTLAQFNILFILKRFRLLQFKPGKAIFCIIIGLLMIQQDGLTLRGICAGILAGFGIYHIVTMFFCKDDSKQKDDNTVPNSSRTNQNPLQGP